jgi:hypothetical protein
MRRLLFSLAIIASVLTACGSTPSAPALTDPKDILTHGARSLQGLRTAHLKLGVNGKINPGFVTGSTGGNQVDLTGTTLEGDLDLVAGAAHVAIAVPGFLGFEADVLATGAAVYVKTSFDRDGKYRKVDPSLLQGVWPPTATTVVPSPDSSAIAAHVSQLLAELDKLPAPTRLADDRIGDQDCYHVQVKATGSDLSDVSGLGTLLKDRLEKASGTLTVDVWTRKSDYRPTRLILLIDAGTEGSLTLTVDLTNDDAPVTIAQPAADKISDQPFSLPQIPFLP